MERKRGGKKEKKRKETNNKYNMFTNRETSS